jgi:hypothetical protein
MEVAILQLDRRPQLLLRASIIRGCKLARCRGGGERRGERREACCNLAAGLGTRTKKICERQVDHVLMIKS